MSDLRKRQEDFRENLANGFDAVEDQELFCIGFDAFRDSPEYKAMKAALEFYADIVSWYVNDSPNYINHIDDSENGGEK